MAQNGVFVCGGQKVYVEKVYVLLRPLEELFRWFWFPLVGVAGPSCLLLTSIKPLLRRESPTTMWKPQFTDPWAKEGRYSRAHA